MFNFKMSKVRQKNLLNNCNFTNIEKFIFNNLVEGKQRKDIYLLAYNEYNVSAPTVNRRIKDIVKKIRNYEEGEKYTHKVYIHKFPNGKKYVGVCQCCEDRWANGLGYAHNIEMFKDIQKYGWENIEHKILLEVSDNDIAYKLERILIDELDLVNNGYNNI